MMRSRATAAFLPSTCLTGKRPARKHAGDDEGEHPPLPNDLRTAALAVGDTLPVFERTTDFPEWNRYAAVNDEFIDVHMSADAAQAAGQPDVFGMGNLKVAYVHAALFEWLDGRGDISRFSCQFRVLNFRGDTLSTHMSVTGIDEGAGGTVVDLAVGVSNQR